MKSAVSMGGILLLIMLMFGVPPSGCLVVPYALLIALYVRIMEWKMGPQPPAIIALFLILSISWGIHKYRMHDMSDAIVLISYLCAGLACIPRRMFAA